MRYLSTSFRVEASDESERQSACDILAALLGDCGYEAFAPSPHGLDAFVPENLYDESAVSGVLERFPMDSVAISCHTESVPDRDWNAAWEQSGFAPISVGDALTVYDARHTDTSAIPTGEGCPLPLLIETTQAFGTGTHQTTQMVLRCLTTIPPMGKSVLDCGCGTGILGIAALRLGSARAVGYDIDEWSVANARHNAALNGVPQLDIRLGDVACLGGIDGLFDIVMANINRNIILADLPQIARKAAPGTTLIFSGFLDADADAVASAARLQGFAPAESLRDGEWACLMMTRCG